MLLISKLFENEERKPHRWMKNRSEPTVRRAVKVAHYVHLVRLPVLCIQSARYAMRIDPVGLKFDIKVTEGC